MKTIHYSITILATILLAWILPNLYHITSDEAEKNIFTYYSSVENSFCGIDYDDTTAKLIRKNMKTHKEYTEAEYDSILPMFYYRQLLSDGRMPDSIHGVPVSPKQIRNQSFFFRHSPKNKNNYHIPLYTLFESVSGRVNLKMPGDVFRLTSKIEFIDPETNEIKKQKSNLFMKEFIKKEFRFPAKIVTGNPSPRKAYDEGYFILDSRNKLFHLKMVNGKPFLKNTNIPSNIKIVHISTLEPSDKSFYAFLFDENNKIYIISTNQYEIVKIPCPDFDIDKNRILIMANPLYWNINVISPQGKKVFAIKSDTKKIVDSLTFNNDISKVNLSNYLFTAELKLESSNSEYIKPHIKVGNYLAFIFNFILLIIFVTIKKLKKQKIKIIPITWIIFTGIFGFIPCLIFNN